MNGTKYKYELTEQAVNFLLNALNRVPVQGVQQAKNLVAIIDLLQNPANAGELQKEQFEALKTKFEPESKKIPKDK
jgi:hypothetical protein